MPRFSLQADKLKAGRSSSMMVLEDARKVVGIGEANLRGYLLHREASADQVRCSLVHLQARQHGPRTFAHEAVEETGQIRRVEMSPIRQFRDRANRAEMRLQKCSAPLESLPCPTVNS